MIKSPTYTLIREYEEDYLIIWMFTALMVIMEGMGLEEYF